MFFSPSVAYRNKSQHCDGTSPPPLSSPPAEERGSWGRTNVSDTLRTLRLNPKTDGRSRATVPTPLRPGSRAVLDRVHRFSPGTKATSVT
jgi:hypothetical protein